MYAVVVPLLVYNGYGGGWCLMVALYAVVVFNGCSVCGAVLRYICWVYWFSEWWCACVQWWWALPLCCSYGGGWCLTIALCAMVVFDGGSMCGAVLRHFYWAFGFWSGGSVIGGGCDGVVAHVVFVTKY